MITVGAVIAAFGIEEFLVSNRIFDGGIVGVAMITAYFTNFKLSILTWVFNVPFLLLAWKMKGKAFVLRSVYAMTVFSASMAFFEAHPPITDESLLLSMSAYISFSGMPLDCM